jgi:hypothetical protein
VGTDMPVKAMFGSGKPVSAPENLFEMMLDTGKLVEIGTERPAGIFLSVAGIRVAIILQIVHDKCGRFPIFKKNKPFIMYVLQYKKSDRHLGSSPACFHNDPHDPSRLIRTVHTTNSTRTNHKRLTDPNQSEPIRTVRKFVCTNQTPLSAARSATRKFTCTPPHHGSHHPQIRPHSRAAHANNGPSRSCPCPSARADRPGSTQTEFLNHRESLSIRPSGSSDLHKKKNQALFRLVRSIG